MPPCITTPVPPPGQSPFGLRSSALNCCGCLFKDSNYYYIFCVCVCATVSCWYSVNGCRGYSNQPYKESGGPRDKGLVKRERQQRLRHAYPADSQRSPHVPFLPSAPSPPLPSKAEVTPVNLHRHSAERLLTKPPLFKSAYFHLISHQYEMGSHERARFTLQRGALFKKNTLIEASLVSLWYRVSSRSPQTYAGSFCLREDEPLGLNVCIHLAASVCFSPGRLRPTCRLKAVLLTRSRDAVALLSVWNFGGKEAFSWSESAVNRALRPAQLFCKWIRSTGILPRIPCGVKQTQIIVFSIFPALLLSLPELVWWIFVVGILFLFGGD